MQILLTGATGFVGSHLLRGLLENGHTICIVKRSFSNPFRIRTLLGDCNVYNLDEVRIEEVYEKQPIDCVVHCATHYVRDNREYEKNIDSNLLFPLKLLGVGKDFGIRYFINTATFFENQFMSEEDLNQPLYSYSYLLSKAQFRQWGHMFASEYGIQFINMKLEHVYGELDNEEKFIPYIVRQCKEHVPSINLSAGTQRRDFIHVSDVVSAYQMVISYLEKQGGTGYQSYNVGTGKERSLKEFVELVHRAVHSTTRLNWGVLPMGKGELMQSRADNSGLIKLGWEPKVVTDYEIEQKFGGGYISPII